MPRCGGANGSAWGANNAIDGMMATEWSSNGDGDNAFIEVDLGVSRTISVLGFRSRKMSDGTSIIQQFQLTVDGSATAGPFDSPNPDTRYLLELSEPVTGQVIRLQALQTSAGNTGIKEFQLFSSPTR